jgi:hypothetical protein
MTYRLNEEPCIQENDSSHERFASIMSYCSLCYFCVIVALFIYSMVIYLNRE